MKKFILCVIAGASALGLSAQRASDAASFSFWDAERADQSVIFGVRAGMNVSSMSFDSDFNPGSKIGFNVGVSMDIPVVNSFYINTGLFYTTRGYKYSEYDAKETLNAGYLQLPIYASYRLNFAEQSQMQINFGPYFACGLNGKQTYEDSYGKSKADVFGKGEDKMGFKRFDFGLGVGAGYTFHKVYLGFEYQFGLANVLNKDDWEFTAKNNNFSLSVGYNF